VTPCQRKVLICALIIPLILIVHTLSFAQLNNIKGLQLNDGTVIYGKVLNMNANIVRMETTDGKIISLKFNDVEAFIKKENGETKQRPPMPLVEKTPATKQIDQKITAESPDSVPVAEKIIQTEQIGRKSSAVTTETIVTKEQKLSMFSMGLTAYYFDYKEDVVLPTKSTESGWLPGLFGSYTYRRNSVFYTKISAQYAAGNLTYDGSTLSGTPIKYDANPQRFIKLEWDFGYPWAISPNLIITPYLGIGFRYWERGKAETASIYTSYREDYSWGYIPAGIRVDYDINNHLRIGVNATVNYMFGGNMKAYLSEVGNYPDMHFTLGDKIGWLAELPITYKFNRKWSLTATPWYEYSAIGESPVNTFGFYEPSSSTNQYGVNLSINYSF
jgi:hypothetical protein